MCLSSGETTVFCDTWYLSICMDGCLVFIPEINILRKTVHLVGFIYKIMDLFFHFVHAVNSTNQICIYSVEVPAVGPRCHTISQCILKTDNQC